MFKLPGNMTRAPLSQINNLRNFFRDSYDHCDISIMFFGRDDTILYSETTRTVIAYFSIKNPLKTLRLIPQFLYTGVNSIIAQKLSSNHVI